MLTTMHILGDTASCTLLPGRAWKNIDSRETVNPVESTEWRTMPERYPILLRPEIRRHPTQFWHSPFIEPFNSLPDKMTDPCPGHSPYCTAKITFYAELPVVIDQSLQGFGLF